jgi:hypothetical protein
MSKLFNVDERCEYICPTTIEIALVLATKIVRSAVFQFTLCNMFIIEGKPHIDQEILQSLLNRDNLFIVDKIRNLNQLDSRACTMRAYDPWRIYFNPIMLIEMRDREYDEHQLLENNDQWEDLMSPNPPFQSNLLPTTGQRRHNSLVFIRQYRNIAQQQNAKKDRNMSKSKRQKHNESAEFTITPSSLNVLEKHIIMLTLMLVHEACHLLNGALSDIMDKDEHGVSHDTTPQKTMKPSDTTPFQDIGHMMELKLFGFVIQHGFSDELPHPFAIDEIIGCNHEIDVAGKILEPHPSLLAYIRQATDDVEISQDILQFTPTSDAKWFQKPRKITIGRFSSSLQDDQLYLVSTPSISNDSDSDGTEKGMPHNPMSSWKA